MNKTWKDEIHHHPFLKGMKSALINEIVPCASKVILPSNKILFREGEEATQCFLILHGAIALELHGPNKETMTIQTIHKGDMMGWSWLFPPYVWHFDARSIKETEAIILDSECLRKKCNQNTDLGYQLMIRFSKVIQQRLQATRLQLLDVYGKNG